MINKNVFYCYSKPLKNFLLSKGERYVFKANHEKTNKRYWVFVSSDALNDALECWKNNKKIKL